YFAGPSASGPGSSTAPTNAGIYTVVASFTSSDPHYGDAQSAPLTFTIASGTPAVDFAGAYAGSYQGTAREGTHTIPVSGGVRFWVDNNGAITVTMPVSGQGTLTPSGVVNFAGAGGVGVVSDASYSYTGNFVISSGTISANGSWTATFSGGTASGAWTASASQAALGSVAQFFTHS